MTTHEPNDEHNVITIAELRASLEDRTDMKRGQINTVIRNAREDAYNRLDKGQYDMHTLKQLIEQDFLTNAQLLHLTELLNTEQRNELLAMVDLN